MFKKSFAPIIPQKSKILILGSLPGDRSLQENQYYAHPQNRFWKTLALLLSVPIPMDYVDRVNLLHRHHIALWDVCEVAMRKGSMDSDILKENPNRIDQLLQDNADIRTICFNGQKAQKLFDKYFNRSPHIQYITLPSSSPANANFNQEQLLSAWEVVRKILSTD
ncbi:DNA-deoxyinosine glycosylase [Sphingobacterium arenae]|uniref:DNA-deoxyinosine glycosylase n=1 Tax=Sphingobacterium arenae TaxID=1280598 RepID=A0ABR7Y5P1_9SPHI|nr:DNA-deoxyinosine glycosylase [Sphingobacterium arenae]MBD1426611.1 DNA-deoxyinosine glycosylase [Sphingobacterium arenae]